jgi:hypothetical protein
VCHTWSCVVLSMQPADDASVGTSRSALLIGLASCMNVRTAMVLLICLTLLHGDLIVNYLFEASSFHRAGDYRIRFLQASRFEDHANPSPCK